ncbi:tetratricopeptide repeat protein [Paraburkholderia acidisoli]|uniref:Tetratricopeptide repeat protein n=1 Tax=Paraburkholderia acidisoli TaxID=2571748 RepID=A0A7Z2JFR0_9BURK|nr:tetratricopeptide repeat protein [Paraburkholderia acidisoli]QGZ61415.1 tetratricopeptide repeat protein [Paraburkholderia acidisoli]
MKKFLAAAGVALAVSLTAASGVAFAVPSLQQIDAAMSQSDWQRADSELTEVLQAHPDSARAHYLYAQVLNREGRYADAVTHVEKAKALDPQVRFTQPQRFAQVEAKLRADAARVNTTTPSRTGNPFAQQQTAAMAAPVAPQRHGPGMGLWIGLAIVVIGVALVLRWTLRRAKSTEDAKAGDDRRDQLKRATELLNGVRSLKLDVRLSTAPGHEALQKEVEGLEAQLRTMVETLSNSTNPRPPYEIEDLERQFASLKARAEGRPDPNAQPAPGLDYGSNSSYAREADAAFGRQPQYPPVQQPQQPPQVIVQQGGGGMMGGMGGLLTGVLLGEALNSGRDRVIERDVYVDDEGRRLPRDDGGNGIDLGQGTGWDDNSGGGMDLGSNDSSDDWSNS